MRVTSLVLALAACGDNQVRPDAAIPDADPSAPCVPARGEAIAFRQIGTVTGGAMLATSPPDDPRLFVIEQRGAIRIFKNEVLQDRPFLDLSVDAGGPVVAGGELGLLGLAFHPDHARNGLSFIYYTTSNAQGYRNVVARCSRRADDFDVAVDCTEILSIDDFAANHNGGMIEFGADGFLYIGTGDGGGSGDPMRVAQDPNSLLGKMLRIDVDTPPYAIPADNPYAAGGGAPEVFIRGLRNPWRWSFDRATGDLWIGDVGQLVIEELTVLRAGAQAGANLGWSVYEGSGCCATQVDRCQQTGAQATCDQSGLVFPQDERTHAEGWYSIVAGQTYRGRCFPDLTGWHFYTDYGAAKLVRARLRADGSLEKQDLEVRVPGNPASLHADARGELYLTTTAGGVYRLEVTR